MGRHPETRGAGPLDKGGFWSALRREALRVTRSRFMLVFMFLLPMATFGILIATFSGGTPRDLPVIVCDRDNSALSREVVRRMDATAALAVAGRVADVAQGAALVRRGRAYALLSLPAGLSRDAARGEAPAVTVFYNNQWLLTGGVLSRAAREAVQSASRDMDRRARMARGEDPARAALRIEPVRVDQHALFNPGMSYGHFLLPALLPTLMQLFIMMATVRAVGGEFRHGTAGGWLESAGGSPAAALFGKLLPHTAAFTLTGVFMWSLLMRFCGTPLHGDGRLLLAATVLFIAAYQSMGCLFVALTGSLRVANSMAGFYCGPAFAFSGITFPVMGMPAPALFWSGILPVSHFLRLVMQQGMQGAPVQASASAVWVLLAFVLLPPLVYLPKLGRLMRDPAMWGRL